MSAIGCGPCEIANSQRNQRVGTTCNVRLIMRPDVLVGHDRTCGFFWISSAGANDRAEPAAGARLKPDATSTTERATPHLAYGIGGEQKVLGSRPSTSAP